MLKSTILSSGLVLMLFLVPTTLHGQLFSVETLVFLPDEAKESSGIVFLNDKIITHNDSGGDPILYEIDPESGLLDREILIDNATNVDWEDICFDQQYLYIGDFGNNNGTREDLRIYRVALTDYFRNSNNILSADTIKFSYQDQVSFNSNPQTNFDAEAIISFADSLYVFTKNWGDFRTNIYSVPKAPGDYTVHKVGGVNAQGLITGGVYNMQANEIMLTGYTLVEPFLLRLSQIENTEFSAARTDRITFEIDGSFQIESIEAINDSDYFITSESNALGNARLMRVNTDFVVSTVDPINRNIDFFPNPVQNTLNISGLEKQRFEILVYNSVGQRVYTRSSTHVPISGNLEIDFREAPDGVYQLKVTLDGDVINHRLIIAQTRF